MCNINFQHYFSNFPNRKKKLADELKVGKMEAKFSAHYDAVEVELKSSTVGLLTIEQVK